MKVLPFITSKRELLEIFRDFLNNYDKVYLEETDVDTLFFNKKGSLKHEIYFHNYFDDVKKEFTYNYTEEEQKMIGNFFGSKKIFIFSIQYRDEKFLNQLLKDLKYYLNSRNSNILSEILLIHPSEGGISFYEK